MSKTRVVVYGLGPIGAKMVNFLHERGAFEIAGGVDIASDKVGKDLGEIGGLGKKTGVVVGSNGRALLERIKQILLRNRQKLASGTRKTA